MPTKIEWTDETWNPITGCTKISAGCQNCYAEKMSKRLAGRYGYPADEPFRVVLHLDKLTEPLGWKKPRMVFVCSMGDLFHERVHFAFIDQIHDVMRRNQQHTFQVLTKRPERIVEYADWGGAPLPSNVWYGVSAENQETADKRIPILLQTPAAVRFVSAEPLLGPISFGDGSFDWLEGWGSESDHHPDCGGDICETHCPVQVQYQMPKLDWVIVGGESGAGARPMHPRWALDIRDQCVDAGVPFMFKQWGAWAPVIYRNQDGKPHLCITPDKNEIVMGTIDADGKKIDNINMKRMGKKAAGRNLDGREWNECPE